MTTPPPPPPPPPAPLLPNILTPDIGKSRSPSVKLLLPAVLVSTGGRDSGEGETVQCTCPVPRVSRVWRQWNCTLTDVIVISFYRHVDKNIRIAAAL